MEIILYGSVARDDFTPYSDVDLLIITNNQQNTKKLFTQFANEIYDEKYVVLSSIFVSPSEFQNGIEPLYRNIKSEGIILWKRKKN